MEFVAHDNNIFETFSDMRHSFATVLLLAAASCGDAFSVTTLGARRHSSSASVAMCGGGPTPEELLLEAIGFLKANDIEKASSNVAEARRVCEQQDGGATDEQNQLLDLLTARLPTKVEEPEPSLADMFPGTQAAPTGESLVLPGTPSMAELAAKAKAKREAAQQQQQQSSEE